MLDDLLQRFHENDRRAFARLLTQIVRGEHVNEILTRIGKPEKQTRVIGVTGGAGVGKSSLIGKLLELIRHGGQTVAVLACDPQSPLSGGALLGDRFRMGDAHEDDGVFIRSLATPGGLGAITENLEDVIHLLRAYGFDNVIIETVGAGQGDTRVRDLVDVFVLLLQPETGDDLQWEKAGVLEVADLVVVHKADLPGAENVEAQVLSMLSLSEQAAPPLLRVSAKSGAGVEELWRQIESFPLRSNADYDERSLLRHCQHVLAERFEQARRDDDQALRSLLRRWRDGRVSHNDAVELLGQLLLSTVSRRSTT